MKELARRDHVTCKVSGMVTEDDWDGWSPASLCPYLDVAVEAIGPNRLMAGCDCPVCLLATGYTRWWNTLREYFAPFSPSEQAAIFGGTAVRFYGLASNGASSANMRLH